jgi:pSer/pThr/pTyr-binding forkhead associated (FHA) protein
MQSHIVPHVVQEAPPPVMKQLSHGFQIRILQGEEYGRTYDLTGMINQGVRLITVGRQPDNVIVIKSDYSDFISRHHCTLEQYSPGIWAIRDGQWMKGPCLWKSSSNGTYVNSTPVSANGFFLKSGDIISMGDVTARFENY